MELNTVLLCFTMAVCVFALLRRADAPNAPLMGSALWRRYYWPALAGILLVAVLVRVARFGEIPYGMNQDGAMAAVDAKALADYGTDRYGMHLPVYFTGWGYAQMSVLLSYLMAPFIKLFGLSVVTARLPTLLVSLISLGVFYDFARRLIGRRAALVALCFLAINPWHIMQSRWALESNLFPHFLLFSIYLLYLGLERRRFFYPAMVLFGFTMYTYGIAFYAVPLLLVVLCAWLLITRRVKWWEAAIGAAVYLLVAWPSLAVVAVNYFKLPTMHAGPFTIPFFPDSQRKDDLLFFADKPLAQVFQNLDSFIEMVVLAKGDFTWNLIEGFGHLYSFSLPFVGVGLLALLRRSQPTGLHSGAAPQNGVQPNAPKLTAMPDAARFFLLAWLAVSLFSGLVVSNVNTNRINIIYYPLCLLAGWGIYWLLFRQLRVRKLIFAVAALYLLSFTTFTATYFGRHADAMAEDFCGGFVDAVRFADSRGAQTLYITAYTRGEQAYTCSEILTQFATGIDAKYLQGAKEISGPDGTKWLPYGERYVYTDYNYFEYSNRTDVIYVFNNKYEGDLFSPEFYNILPFGNYAVAMPLGNIPPPEEEQPEDGDGGEEQPDDGGEQLPPPDDGSAAG